MSVTFDQAMSYAAWWTRCAADLAPDQPGLHAGVIGHLTAGRVQLNAAERLQAMPAVKEAA